MVWKVIIQVILKNGLGPAIKKYGLQRISLALKNYGVEIDKMKEIVDSLSVKKKLGEAKSLILQDYTNISKNAKNLNFLKNKTNDLKSGVNKAKQLVHKTLIEDPKEAFKIAQNFQDGDGEYASLSSSWVESGVYYKEERILDLKTKKGHTVYVYKNVPLFVWVAMKAAKGKNGTGAGSVLWQANILGSTRTNIYARSKKYGATGIV